jgi:hypothetical protein
MAAGDREFRVKEFIIKENDSVQAKVEFRIIASTTDPSDWQVAYLSLPWATFWAALTAGQKSALGAAKTTAIALLKATYAPCNNAVDVT